MKIRGAIALPRGRRMPNRHVLYRRYAEDAHSEAEWFVAEHGLVLASDPPEFVGVESHGDGSDIKLAVFEFSAYEPAVEP